MEKKFILTCLSLFLIWVSFFSLPTSTAAADKSFGLSEGQMVYVPCYSHIYIGNKDRPFLLTITLSVRNINPHHSIKIILADYYETQGKLLKRYQDEPIMLKPLDSLRYIVPEHDKSGGSGANFIVEWTADTAVNPPIVEAIMIGTQSQQGISFTSRGQAVISLPDR